MLQRSAGPPKIQYRLNVAKATPVTLKKDLKGKKKHRLFLSTSVTVPFKKWVTWAVSAAPL